MSVNLLAKRYARALFDLALEQKVQDKIAEDMKLIDEVLRENKELRRILSNPVIAGSKKVKVLEAIFKKHVNKLTLEFFKLLIKKNRESYLDSVSLAYLKIHRDYYHILPTTLVTAYKTTKATKEAVMKKVKEVTNKKIELHEVLDDSIIGGLIILYDDYQYDASIKTQLNKLHKQLSSSL
jgi:F-type H+-transporting ATPase subunit delta